MKFIFIEGDQHAGNVDGLAPEVVTVIGDDGLPIQREIALSEIQKDILNTRKDAFKYTRRFASGHPLLYLNTGDITQGTKYVDSEMGIGQYGQNRIAFYNILDAVENLAPDIVRIDDGTPSHDLDAGRTIAEWLLRWDPDLDLRIGWHGVTDFDGFLVDHKHHGPAKGSRVWTSTNSAENYLKSEMMDELEWGGEPAHLYVRAHVHNCMHVSKTLDWGGKWMRSDLIVSPPQCGVGPYPRQVIINLKRFEYGAILVEIDDDNQIKKVHRLTKFHDLRYKERV